MEPNELVNKSALVKHVFQKEHQIDWNNSKILAKETDYSKRRFLESLFIHTNQYAFNDKINCFYSNTYNFLKDEEF